MRELPSGTVTFLFTDIEGSTRLLQQHGDRYAELLAEHRRVLREAFARYDGVEVDTQGDAFFVAFARASAALAAARDGQAALEDGPIRVRMGLHTGEPLLTDEGYVGMDVHRAARIAAAGHGGQVLVSQSTRDLGAGDGLRDLGEHRLKDLSAPERLYQLGDVEFPRLKTLYQTNLPVPATPFLGRRRELDDVVSLLRRDDTRLVTLTGPGGTGKTRLALQAAAELAEDAPDGVWWVPLAALRDSDLALDAVAKALDVRERPGASLEETLVDALTAKRAVLLIDNAEHLLPEVASAVARLRDAGGPKLLVTSRERLQLQGEHAWLVPSLSDDDGTALFAARARALRPDFIETSATAALCARLDNLPLALELAAARTPAFSPEQLLERLGRGVELKGGRDADPRQQTLSATIRWSYDLLTPAEQRLFRRLSVFAGGCTYEAAEVVCGADADTLQSLIDKSLVRTRQAAGDTRYWMLETIREFAAEALDASGEVEELRRLHSEFAAALVEHADPFLRHGPDQQLWLDRVAADYDNIRTATAFALEREPTVALRLVGSLTFFVWVRGGYAETMMWLDAILPRLDGQPPRLVGRVLELAASVAHLLGDAKAASRYAEQAYAEFALAGDEQGMIDALRERGKVASLVDDHDAARLLYTELAERADRIGDRWNSAIALNNLGDVALNLGDWERAIELCGRSATLRRELGDEWGMALALTNVAVGEYQLSRFSSAAITVREALEASLKTDAKVVVYACFQTAAAIAARRGGMHEAARLIGAGSRLQEELGAEWFEAELLGQGTLDAIGAALGAETDAEIQRGYELSHDDALALIRAVTHIPIA